MRVCFKVLILIMMFGSQGLRHNGTYIVSAQSGEKLLPFESGPYFVGRQTLQFTSESPTLDWEIEVEILYPSNVPDDVPADRIDAVLKRGWDFGAPPNDDGGPYPLLVYSHGWTQTHMEALSALRFLASHGFVTVAVDHYDYSMPHAYVNRVLEIKAVLDGLENSESELANIIDINKTGLIGFSQGAEATFQMIGLMTDVSNYVDWCTENVTAIDCSWLSIDQLEIIDTYRIQAGLDDASDGSWQPFEDERVQAIMVIAPCTFPLITEESLAAVSVPVLITQGTSDRFCDYTGNAVRDYENITTPDRFLITIDQGIHRTMNTSTDVRTQVARAFFGYYLEGDDAYLDYLTAEFIESFDDAVWGALVEDQ